MIKPYDLQVGITTRCTGNCYKNIGFCSRRFLFENDIVPDNYKKRDLDLDIIKPLFDIHGFKKILFSGWLGEPIMHPYFLDFIKYLRDFHPDVEIVICTNGEPNNDEWWSELGDLISDSNNSEIIFAIDGLKDTHYLYRGTNYEKIIKHSKILINRGGSAVWRYIIFKHNEHQVKDAKKLSEELGFIRFESMISMLYNDKFEKPDKLLDINRVISSLNKEPKSCSHRGMGRIYLSEGGEVLPCCRILPFTKYDMVQENSLTNDAIIDKELRNIYFSNRDKLNLYKYDLNEILESPYIKYVYSEYMNIKDCRDICGMNEELRHKLQLLQTDIFFK